jgi:hypothetical protein
MVHQLETGMVDEWDVYWVVYWDILLVEKSASKMGSEGVVKMALL